MGKKYDVTRLQDLHGEKYVRKFEANQSEYRIARLLSNFELASSHVVADFGCGNGMLMSHVAPIVKQYHGVDFSEAFIAKAKERLATHRYENAYLHFSSIRDFANEYRESFDCGFALDLSEHVPDPQWGEILRDIHKSLKPHGKLYLHTPNGDFFVEKMKSRNFILKQFPEHVAVRNRAENLARLAEAGFSRIVFRAIAHYNVLRLFHPISFIPGVGRFFGARLLIVAEKL